MASETDQSTLAYLESLPVESQARLWDDKGLEQLEKFLTTGIIDDIDRAIVMADKAVNLSPSNDPHRTDYVYNLAMALQTRFERTGSINDLDRAIAMNTEVLNSMPGDDLNRPGCLNNLGNALQSRFETTGSIEDLDRATEMNKQAVEAMPANHPYRAMFLNNLSVIVWRRSEITGTMEDLDSAIEMIEKAAEATPADQPSRTQLLGNLAIALQSRFERTAVIGDLDRSIQMNEEAVASTSTSLDRAWGLKNLGYGLQRRFERTDSIDVLDRAIEVQGLSVRLTPIDHPDRAMRFHNLSVSLRSRFERTGLIEDLERTINANEQAVKLIPENHPNRAMCLNNFAVTLRKRFDRIGSTEDLNQAIEMNEKAIEVTSAEHPHCATYLHDLGNALRRRSERLGSMEDLNRAISINEQAVTSTPADHPDHPLRLNNLGVSLQLRFEKIGSIEDLDRAIEINEQAVESMPVEHPLYAGRLANLAITLWWRFETSGSVDDLDRAIEANRRAVDSTPENVSNRAMYLNNSSNALRSRFNRTRSTEDLDGAIEMSRQALELTPADHPHRAGRLNNLCMILLTRSLHSKTGSTEDLDSAIETNQQAVKLTPSDHPNRARYLNNLGYVFVKRFEKTGSEGDLNRAIETTEEAVKSTTADNPDHAVYLNNLGNSLLARFYKIGTAADLDRSIEMKEQATKSHIAPPFVRLEAARSCSSLLITQRKYARALPVLQVAVDLLPKISPRRLRQNDSQFNISQFSDITSTAVAVCLECGVEVFESLQLLELGRGVLANLQLEVRSDISVLADAHQELAREFQQLRDKIDTPIRLPEELMMEDSSIRPSLTTPRIISDYRALHKRFNAILIHIRSLAGFENFLKGPTKVELHSLATAGAIVAFNVSEVRSDAFLITDTTVRVLRLPLLTPDIVVEFVKDFHLAIHERDLTEYLTATRKMNGVMEGLWNRAVKPILDELGFSQAPSNPAKTGQRSRVWWVGSRLLNVLPIDAAGFHTSKPPQTALDRVISSYSSTVKSLVYARERATAADRIERENAILYGMPADLPSARSEIQGIQNLLRTASVSSAIVFYPIKAKVCSELPKHTIVHFACHGRSMRDPSESCLVLQGQPLTVSDLVSMKIEPAKFAYLSACHSSGMQDPDLLDESIHLSSAVQLCGYPSVVGTLWQVNDKYAAKVASDVYSWVLKNSKPGMFDARQSAEGLHEAVHLLRKSTRGWNEHDPITWASFIHTGI